ncbi:sensor histidine kinase [Kutzneria sp. CA-103260]|uniref:sensor histidine kinase n=1 Tax=Kutzneria sp. CA-103260 TaxID=2802641 RepID=UPI001BA537B7|nr:nitrate- and nitrite sensing domain-containing protein [Kutzneria sp. CA-103260]QUQ67895.1 two-component system sensor kinase [Kutzneria sp. CA-103260]
MLTASSGRHELIIGAFRWRIRRIADWPLRTKLAMVLLTPTVVAAVLGATQASAQLALANRASGLTGRVAVAARATVVVHALQRERDLAVVPGAAAKDLAAARAEVDGAVAALDTELAGDAEVAGADDVADARKRLRDLDATRRSVGSDGPGSSEVLAGYSALIAPLLAIGVPERDDVGDSGIGTTAAALGDVGKAIEQVQIEKTVLAAATTRGTAQPDAVATVRVAAALADDALGELRQTLAADGQSALDGVVGGQDRLGQLRDAALSRAESGRSLALSPQAWQQAAQPVVDQLTAFEGTLAESLRTAVDGIGASSWTSSLRDVALVVGALLLGLAIALYFATTMIRPLWTLRRRALEVADRELPGIIDRFAHDTPNPDDLRPVPVAVTTTEEIGQVARAFDEVHASAVRLAADQAALRHQVNEIFVNLSLRTQSLVQSQLKMIDTMEADELDPDRLDRLFRLDHLATRMRRNSENLLVLAGATLRRTTSQQVPVGDLLRAAVSEVEQYTRITLEPTPESVVVGAAVSDIVHLLAELLDNATAFSAPDTTVAVACTTARSGALRIAVADNGVGLPPAELAALNQQLTDQASIEAAASKRMGLFVVSRLASRRGITVRLRANAGGGTVAEVELPAELLRPADEVPLPTAPVLPQPVGTVVRQRNFAVATVIAARKHGPGQGPPAVQAEEQHAWPDEEPAEGTPLYESVASAWFRSTGRQDDDRIWRADVDSLWRTGDRLDAPVSAGLTAAGLPRRIRGALLLRGSVPTAADSPDTTGEATP